MKSYTIVYYDIFGELVDVRYVADSKEDAMKMFDEDSGGELAIQCVYEDDSAY